jgi:para-aminobenzoate synthetase / 4-amino-4-deoxychorismate lyase
MLVDRGGGGGHAERPAAASPLSSPAMRAARFDDFASPEGESFELVEPRETVTASTPEEVAPALARVEAAVAGGLWAAGFVAYEAAPGLDPGLAVRPRPPAGAPFAELPLVAFGLFAGRRALPGPRGAAEWTAVGGADGDGAGAGGKPSAYQVGDWEPSVSRAAYDAALAAVQERIAAGDTYQVNLTFRLRAPFAGDPLALYLDLARAQGGAYAGRLDLGALDLLCASPELFFEIDGERLTTRPMKGTAPRGRWSEEDRAAAARLAASPKERAENVMVVDLLRNDLGRLAAPGTVTVERLFEAERYPTVWQLTSTVSCRLAGRPALADVFTALFPCGSITGAPKRSTMAIAAALEETPRGAYTGAVGWLAPPGAPGPRARFAVAIRTVTIDKRAGIAEYGLGGGVTAGSSAAGEHEEALLKARVLAHRRPAFGLIETLRWEPGRGFPFLVRHLDRLAASAEYFGFACNRERVEAALAAAVGGGGEGGGGAGAPLDAAPGDPTPTEALRVRLTLSPSGEPSVTVSPLPPPPGRPLRLAVDPEPVDPAEPLLFHKTTLRAPYDRRRARWPEHDDVLLVNGRGEITESTIANLAVRLDGRWWTPPLASGCLPGVYRGELLARGEIEERPIRRADLEHAEGIALLNAVRLWRAAELATAAQDAARVELSR